MTRSKRFPNDFMCPRGAESYRDGKALWDADETCSWCGSLHPDVLMERIRLNDIELGPTDKDYKIYVKVLSGEPLKAIKFYFQHLSEDQRQEFVDICNAKKMTIGYPGHFYVLPFFMTRV